MCKASNILCTFLHQGFNMFLLITMQNNLHTRIWGNRKGQPNRSLMEGPHPGGLASLISDIPVPLKHDLSV